VKVNIIGNGFPFLNIYHNFLRINGCVCNYTKYMKYVHIQMIHNYIYNIIHNYIAIVKMINNVQKSFIAKILLMSITF